MEKNNYIVDREAERPVDLPPIKNLYYIVFDAEQGRREIAPGAGKVSVCLGFEFVKDRDGMRREVPVYRTETF